MSELVFIITLIARTGTQKFWTSAFTISRMVHFMSTYKKYANDERQSTAGRLKNALDPATSGSVMGKQSAHDNFPKASLYRKH